MKINYSEIKNSFWKYLEQLQDPSIDLTNIDTLSIFSFSDKLKEFLASEYNFDESIFSYNLEEILSMPVDGGQFVDGIAETDEFPELPEVPSDETDEAEVVEETETTEEAETTEETEEVDHTEDDENNFFKEYLNEFLQDSDVIEALDIIEKDGVLSDAEIDNFFKQIAGFDGNAEDVSMTDIQTAFEKIKDGSFVLEQAGAAEETADDTTIPETTDVTETEDTTPTTPTTPTNPGNNNGGGYNPPSSGGDDGKDDGKVNYSNMSIEDLQSARDSKQKEIDDKHKEINDIYSGKDKVVDEAQTTADTKKQEYEAAVDADEKLDAAQKEAIKKNDQLIADKEIEITATQQLSNETAAEIDKTQNEIDDLGSTIDALKESQTKLQSQKSDDPDEQAQIDDNLQKVTEEIAETERKKQDKETEKTQLEADKKAYDELVEKQQGELEALKKTRDDLTAEASDETKTALQAWKDAEAKVEETKTSRLNEVNGELDTKKTELGEIYSVLRDKQAAATQKKYKVGQPDLYTDAPFEVTKVQRNGMDYIVVGPKGADPKEELPVLVYLHGSGEKGTNLSQLEDASLLKMIEKNPDQFGPTFNGYIIMPQSTGGWTDKGQEVRDIVNEFAQTHAIDRENIAIGGHSMGGIGALAMAGSNDDHFFSSALVLSGYNPGGNYLKNINIPVIGFGESGNSTESLISNAAQHEYYPSGTWHGDVPRDAFTHRDKDGQSTILRFLFPDYANA